MKHNGNTPLIDPFGRVHNYLRLSLTDKCNFRCTYCMPDKHIKFMPNDHLMKMEEIIQIVSTFVDLGINKIRLTGGEPLVRADFKEIIARLSTFPVSLHITTNGYLLDEHIDSLLSSGFKTVNISLDSLENSKFNSITQTNGFKKVMDNIQLASKAGLKVKLNNVLMKGINENEIIDFINLTQNNDMSIRFIEFMPFSKNEWQHDKAITLNDILEQVNAKYPDQIIPIQSTNHSTTKDYRISGFKGDFGIISTVSAPFCTSCNRIRLTADGKIKNCLFATVEIDLLSALREGKDITTFIQQSISSKKESRGGMTTNEEFKTKGANHENRSMISIGG